MKKGNEGTSGSDQVKDQGPGSLVIRLLRDDGVIHPSFVEGETMIDLLRRIGIRVDGAVVIRGGTPIPVDEAVRSNDDITVIDVQSGG